MTYLSAIARKTTKAIRWVSEFDNALKTELESTFKEDISIYFDENQYDGLLETHDVDASLKDKLRFLVLFQLSPEHIAITIFN